MTAGRARLSQSWPLAPAYKQELSSAAEPQTSFIRDHCHPPRMSKKQIYYSDKYNDEEFEYRYEKRFGSCVDVQFRLQISKYQ